MCNNENKERGSIVIIAALSLTMLLLLGSFLVDFGRAYVQMSQLQNAVDASVLAAVQELPDTTNALNYADQYISSNGFSPSDIDVSFSNGNETVTVTGTKTFNYSSAGPGTDYGAHTLKLTK